MKTVIALSALLIASTGTAALANGNSSNAQTMVTNIQGTPKGIASDLSGKPNGTAAGDSGWGNIGSRATSDGEAQVSKSGKSK